LLESKADCKRGRIDVLTELAGAILSEIHHRGEQTAFRVRRSFALSPSLEWRGSAGSVYAAIKRLEADGMIKARVTGDGRATRVLSITRQGRDAMFVWACDAGRASSVGIDPFRMRAGIWTGLDADAQRKTLRDVRAALEAAIAAHKSFSRNNDIIERSSVDLALRLQKLRLAWLKEFEKAVTDN
jgi:DNA-binding PadR family transcriptional regulator